MSTTPKFIQNAIQDNEIGWPLAKQIFRTEGRFQTLLPSLAEMLSVKTVPFLPDANTPSFLERDGAKKEASVAADPLSIYWTDLGKLRPTNREEEFILGRAIFLLRKTITNIITDNPTATIIAIAQEHLSSYSNILSELKENNIVAIPGHRCRRGATRLLQQRLRELHNAQSALVDRNLHLVPAIASRYRGVGVGYEDMIQEGNTALLRAVERFDHTQNVRFASYANWWISQGILHALSFQARTVRLPVYLVQALNRVRNARASSPNNLGYDELAGLTSLSEDRVERAINADCSCVSLNSSRNENDDQPLSELLEDPSAKVEFGEPSHSSLRNSLQELLNRLPSREALVLRLRFGLDGKEPHTLEEVRQVLGVSRERVRQLQAQALRRLNQPTPQKELAKFA